MTKNRVYHLGLELLARSYHCLYCMGIDTLKKLLDHTKQDLFKCKNLGQKTINDIENELKLIGLKLRTEICPFCGSDNTTISYFYRKEGKWECQECFKNFKGGVK